MTNHRRDRRDGAGPGSLEPNSDFGVRRRALLEEALTNIVRDELSDPRLEPLTITRLELRGGGSAVRLYWRHPEPEDAEAALEKATPFVQARLAERLPKKRAVTVRFVKDPLWLDDELDSGRGGAA